MATSILPKIDGPVRCAVYIRMSGDEQEDSPERQRSTVFPYIEKRGYILVGEPYEDHAVSGSKHDKREHFVRLLADAQAGKFDVIVCDNKKRLSRQDPIEYIEKVVAPLRRARIRVETVADGLIDWYSTCGIVIDTMKQGQANEEAVTVGRDVLTQFMRRSRDGDLLGGKPPYGYVVTYTTKEKADNRGRTRTVEVPDRLVIHEEKAKVVRWMFEAYGDQDSSLDAIRDELHARGVPGPRGSARWGKTTIGQLLQNRKYVGDWTYNLDHFGLYARAVGGEVVNCAIGNKRGRNAEADWIIIPYDKDNPHHEPIIDRDLFARVQARMRQNRERTSPKKNRGDFVFSKLMVCKHCGSWMVGSRQGGHKVYRCGGNMRFGVKHCTANYVREEFILDAVLRELQETFLNPANLESLREDMRQLVADRASPAEVARLKKRAEQLRADIDRGNANLRLIPPDLIPGAVAAIRKDQEALAGVAEDLRQREGTELVQRLEQRIARAEKWLWNLREAANRGDPLRLRVAVREAVGKIELEWDVKITPKRHRTRFRQGFIHIGGEIVHLSGLPRHTEQVSYLPPLVFGREAV